eukprot:87776_1
MEQNNKENINKVNTTQLITNQLRSLQFPSNSNSGNSHSTKPKPKPSKPIPQIAQNSFPPPPPPLMTRPSFAHRAQPIAPPPALTHPSMIASTIHHAKQTSPKHPRFIAAAQHPQIIAPQHQRSMAAPQERSKAQQQSRPKAQQPRALVHHQYGRHKRPIGKHTTSSRCSPYKYKYNHYLRCVNNVRNMMIFESNADGNHDIKAVDRAVTCHLDNIRFIICDSKGVVRKRFFDSHSAVYHNGNEFTYLAFGMGFSSVKDDDLNYFKGLLSERAKQSKKKALFAMISAHCKEEEEEDEFSDGEEDDDDFMNGMNGGPGGGGMTIC